MFSIHYTLDKDYQTYEYKISESLMIKQEFAISYKKQQTLGSKLAKFSNSRFLSLFFTSKLAVPLLSTQIRDFCYFLSPKIREFGGITVYFNNLRIGTTTDEIKRSSSNNHH